MKNLPLLGALLTMQAFGIACCESGRTEGDADADFEGDADTSGDGDRDADGDRHSNADVDGEGDAAVDGKSDGEADIDGGCGFPWEHTGEDPFIDSIVEFSPAEGATFGASELPDIVRGPPLGGGSGAGSLDVVSLGCGGSITLRFDEPRATDGPGPDLIVFENPFITGDSVFAEPAQVWVSADGESFVPFPCDPVTLVGCAGQNAVLSSPDNCLDPTDPSVAGGDAFDLADVGLTEVTVVRLEDRSTENPGATVWCDGESSGFDLDAMAVVVR